MWTSVPMNLGPGSARRRPMVIIFEQDHRELAGRDVETELLGPLARCGNSLGIETSTRGHPTGKKNWWCTLTGMSELDSRRPEAVVLRGSVGEEPLG